MKHSVDSRDGSDPDVVLARFRSELDLVDLNGRQIKRQLGRVWSVTLDDLRAFGREGLLHAARTFHESRGVPFRRWANLRIRGAIVDGVRRWGPLPRRVYRQLSALERAEDSPVAQPRETDPARSGKVRALDAIASYIACVAAATVAGDTDRVPERLLVRAEIAHQVRVAVAGLPDAERAMVERHHLQEETLERAAASLGLSKSWGSRLHARAIGMLADQLREVAAA